MVLARTSSPDAFSTQYVHVESDNGHYYPRPLSPDISPRAAATWFARVPGRPSPKADVWRVARTTGRTTYLPKNNENVLRTTFPAVPEVPGPGAYDPRSTPAGKAFTISQRASTPSFNVRLRQSKSVTDPHWPEVSKRPQSSQYRYRTLGDGTQLLVPEPGLKSPPPQIFRGRETALLFDRGSNMLESRIFARETYFHGVDHDSPPLTPSRLRPELAAPTPMFFWFLPPDDERPATRPKLLGHNFRKR